MPFAQNHTESSFSQRHSTHALASIDTRRAPSHAFKTCLELGSASFMERLKMLQCQILCIRPVALSLWRGSRIRTAGNATGRPVVQRDKLGIRAKHNTGLCIGIHRLKSKNLGHTECSWCALLLHSNFHCLCYENLSVCANFQYVL